MSLNIARPRFIHNAMDSLMVKNIKSLLTCFVNEAKDDWDHIQRVSFAYNSSLHSTTGYIDENI